MDSYLLYISNSKQSMAFGQVTETWCSNCHSKMKVSAESVRFAQLLPSEQDLGMNCKLVFNLLIFFCLHICRIPFFYHVEIFHYSFRGKGSAQSSSFEAKEKSERTRDPAGLSFT